MNLEGRKCLAQVEKRHTAEVWGARKKSGTRGGHTEGYSRAGGDQVGGPKERKKLQRARGGKGASRRAQLIETAVFSCTESHGGEKKVLGKIGGAVPTSPNLVEEDRKKHFQVQ